METNQVQNTAEAEPDKKRHISEMQDDEIIKVLAEYVSAEKKKKSEASDVGLLDNDEWKKELGQFEPYSADEWRKLPAGTCRVTSLTPLGHDLLLIYKGSDECLYEISFFNSSFPIEIEKFCNDPYDPYCHFWEDMRDILKKYGSVFHIVDDKGKDSKKFHDTEIVLQHVAEKRVEKERANIRKKIGDELFDI